MPKHLFRDDELKPSSKCPRMEKVRRLCSRATLRVLRDLVDGPLWSLISEATKNSGYENPSRFAHPLVSEILLRTPRSEWDTLTHTDARQKILRESFAALSYRLN